uniref:Uncharacterized protein n=1 Tax=Arundo donax TaxID=35708 RepID=A0A0A9HH29_ARUDO
MLFGERPKPSNIKVSDARGAQDCCQKLLNEVAYQYLRCEK